MNLDKEIQLLIDNAPEDVTPHVVAAIAPVLKLLAGQLRHSVLYPSKLGSKLGFDNIKQSYQPDDVEKCHAFPTYKISQLFAELDLQDCQPLLPSHSVPAGCLRNG